MVLSMGRSLKFVSDIALYLGAASMTEQYARTLLPGNRPLNASQSLKWWQMPTLVLVTGLEPGVQGMQSGAMQAATCREGP